MKKIFIGFSVFFFLAILWLGIAGLTFEDKQQFEIGTEQQDIYQYLIDISYYPQWYNGFIRHSRLRGQMQSEGLQNLLLVSDEGQEFRIIETLVQLDSPQTIIKEHQHDFYNLDIKIQISKVSEGHSKVNIEQSIYGTRFIERLLLPLYAHQVMKEHLSNYKDAIQILEAKQ